MMHKVEKTVRSDGRSNEQRDTQGTVNASCGEGERNDQLPKDVVGCRS